MKRIIFLIALCFGAAMLAACSSSPPPAEFTIEMTEFAYSPDTIEVQVGQEVTIHLVNNGALSHEFMIGRDPMMMDGMPSGYEHNMFEGHEPQVNGNTVEADDHEDSDTDDHDSGMEDMDHGFMVMVDRDETDKTLTFTVTEDMVGEWEIGCFTDGGSHYQQGMTGTFIVNP